MSFLLLIFKVLLHRPLNCCLSGTPKMPSTIAFTISEMLDSPDCAPDDDILRLNGTSILDTVKAK